ADEQDESVLNGIAYLPQTKHLLVTGKLWPRMYEIEVIPESSRGTSSVPKAPSQSMPRDGSSRE
ncbi:MAG: hypothetical protein EHM13_11080, partial [Acidobacteria bacterium]